MTTCKEIKFPKFDRSDPQKFFEGCIQSYKENLENWVNLVSTIKIYEKGGWTSFYQGFSDIGLEIKREAIRALSEADSKEDRIVLSLLSSYARICIEGDKLGCDKQEHEEHVSNIICKLQSPCWCCVLVNMGLDDLHCNPSHPINSCPASSFCFDERTEVDINPYARNVVLAGCRFRGNMAIDTWFRWLPNVAEFNRFKADFKTTLRKTIL